MLTWLLKLIPDDYKWSVMIKKAAYTVGKLAVAALMYGKAKTIVGNQLTPDQLKMVQDTAGVVTAGFLEGVHDWAKLKWPNTGWL